MGRFAGTLALLCLTVSAAACKGDEGAEAAKGAEALEDPEEIAEEEDDLLARRDALLAAREKLRDRRKELAERRAEVVARGGDTSEIDAEASKLLEREREILDKETAFYDRIQGVLERRRAQLAALAGEGDQGGAVAAREAELAARENGLARREERIAEREEELAAREERMASRWKESCLEGVPAMIQQPAPAPAAPEATRGDVERLLRRARRGMSKKGILRSDLPEQARGLEKEASRAMEEGDFGRARFAASQLASTVRGIAINKAFIAGKFSRLNKAMRGKRLSNQQEQLLKAATSSYGDGRYRRANQKLNKIYATL